MKRCSLCEHSKIFNSDQMYCTQDGEFVHPSECCNSFEVKVVKTKKQRKQDKEYEKEKIRELMKLDDKNYKEWLENKSNNEV